MLGARRALTLAGLSLLGLVVTWLLAALVPATHTRDAILLADFTRLNHSTVHALAKGLLWPLETPVYVVWCTALVVLALRRSGLRLSLVALVLLACAPISAELLKPLFAHEHAYAWGKPINAASWPSGHSTEAAILVWVAVMVAPARRRAVLALSGAVFVLCVGAALLIRAWHMPSDVLGGYLLATLWASLGVAVLARRGPVRRVSAAQASGAEPWAPGSHSDSAPSPVSPLAARARMKSRSDSLLR